MKKIKKYVKLIVLCIIILLSSVFYNNSNAEENNNIDTNSKIMEELVVKTEYIYNDKDNTITGKIISNNPLKNTKISWKLSEDKLTYTTTLRSNGSYTTTVEDVYGNVVEVLIEVTGIDETGPTITMEYIYNKTDNTVTGIMHSDEVLKDTKVSWDLSEDKKNYTTILRSNGAYITTVEDVWGNKTQVLKIKRIIQQYCVQMVHIQQR